eukprot:gb/GEZN01025681.1/.p1 GENE.gb/GEZN01025681.1/~~gb/GEZN01025681.1/.p1  ORF type:complete len:107 (-),score=12.27 gb/GEZN01025681.1/:159-479(-)
MPPGSRVGDDPRMPQRIRRYEEKINADDLPADWLALASLVFGVMGLMMRYKICAWIALFACMGSIANMRKVEMDTKQILCSLLFAVMGLIMNYFGLKTKRDLMTGS